MSPGTRPTGRFAPGPRLPAGGGAEAPDGLIVLGGVPQVIRVGRAAWGVQFHPEADERIIAARRRPSSGG